jgi:hypothetical protein
MYYIRITTYSRVIKRVQDVRLIILYSTRAAYKIIVVGCILIISLVKYHYINKPVKLEDSVTMLEKWAAFANTKYSL